MAFGALYAMAQDDVCILADQYLTLGAQRASFHGAGEGDANLRSDFLYQLFIDRGDAAEPLPPEIEAVFEGAAAGYDHYLAETGALQLAQPRGLPGVTFADGLAGFSAALNSSPSCS